MSVETHTQPFNINSLLTVAAGRFGHRLFLSGDKRLTYREADELVEKLAGRLTRRGLRRGERVLIVSRNRAEIVLLLFAVTRAGGIFSVLNNSIKPFGFRRILAQTRPRMVALDEGSRHLRPECSDALVISFEEAGADDGEVSLPELLTRDEGGAASCPRTIDLDPAALIFTSGSTGDPRGVILSHDNILFTTRAIQARLGYEADDVVGVYLPLSFDYGLYQVFLAAQAGATLHLSSPENVRADFIQQLAAARVSVLPGVPAIFNIMCALLARKPQPLPALRIITNTGDHLSKGYIEQLQTFIRGVRVFPMYGLTECKRVSILLPEELERKPQTVGRPLDGTRVSVVDEEGRELAPGEVGELLVRGRNVCLGYWGCPEETARAYRRDPQTGAVTLWSGDLAKLDEDGYVTFVARKDSLIKHKGYRVNPAEIETAACDIASVLEAGAVKLPDGALVLAVSVNGGQTTAADIFEGLKSRLEDFKLPDRVYVREALPKSRNGKIDRGALLEAIEGGGNEF